MDWISSNLLHIGIVIVLGLLTGAMFGYAFTRFPIVSSALPFLKKLPKNGFLVAVVAGIVAIAIWTAGAAAIGQLMSPTGDRPATSWAYVTADGAVIGHGVDQTNSRSTVGRYAITFTQDVDSCFYSATPVDPVSRSPLPAMITLSQEGPHTVVADIYRPSGQPIDEAFYLIADCTGARPGGLINASGVAVRAVGLSSTRRDGVGAYEVETYDSVTTCEFNASPYIASSADHVPTLVTLNRNDVHGLLIDVVNVGGSHVDSSFSLSLDCSSSGRWAYVDNDGYVQRGTGLGPDGATWLSAGEYDVSFDTHISSCAYAATVKTPDDSAAVPALVYVGIGNADTVSVDIIDGSGNHVDRGFYLDVVC